MISLIQRVSSASVTVDGNVVGSIGTGLLALIGVEKTDDAAKVERLASRIAGYRVFGDSQGRMNLSVEDVGGGVLLVPQFTLAADTRKGMRPGFSSAAEPARGEAMFLRLVDIMHRRFESGPCSIQAGRFGADMKVSLLNDGPVTFWLQV